MKTARRACANVASQQRAKATPAAFLLAVVVLAACGAAERSTSAAAAANDGGVEARPSGDGGSQLLAADEHSATNAGRGMVGASAASPAGSGSSLGSAGVTAAAGGDGVSAAVAGAQASGAAGGGAAETAAAGGSTASASAVAGGASGSVAAGSGGHGPSQQGFTLLPVGLAKANDMELAFPADAINTVSISPEFMWTGVPSNAKSLALVFRDLSMSIVKWIVWDIPPTVTDLPKGISQDSGMLKEIPGAMQLGALGHQGYYGPCCTENHYEWVLWALDVEKLPVTAGQTTETIRDTIIPAHQVASTPAVLMRRVTP